jgi:hypothetical protein
VSRRKQGRGEFLEARSRASQNEMALTSQSIILLNNSAHDDCERFKEGDCLPGMYGDKMNTHACANESAEWGGSFHPPMSQALLSLL